MFCRKPVLFQLIAGITLLVSLSALISCKKKEEAAAPAPAESSSPVAESPSAPAAPEAAPEGREKRGEGPVPQEKKRKVILNHSISLEVKDFSVALEALTTLAESSGGYVFKSDRTSPEKGSSMGQVGIRVPAGKSSGVMRSIRGLGRVESENSTAEDITEGYVDLEARLKNARASEARLLELYRRAGKIEDMLTVEEEVSRVRGDIEAYEAKKKNWDILTEMVTIEVSLHDPAGNFPSFHRLWSPVRDAFGKSLQMLADSLQILIIFVGAIAPWLAVFGPLAYLFVKRQRKKRAIMTVNKTNEEPRQGE